MPRTFYAGLLAAAAAIWTAVSSRAAVIEILRDTRGGLPAYFKPSR